MRIDSSSLDGRTPFTRKEIETTRKKKDKRQPADLLVKTLFRPNGYERGKFNEVAMRKRVGERSAIGGPTSAGWFPSRYKRVRDQTSVASSKGERNEWRGIGEAEKVVGKKI